MRKNLLIAMSAIIMLFATSCQDDLGIDTGNEALVSFNVTTPEMVTRAYGEGSMATNLQYAVYDAGGNEYEINQWSSTYGDFDENGNATFFYDEFPLKKFVGDEVWLTPHFSHNWVAEDLIVVTIQ